MSLVRLASSQLLGGDQDCGERDVVPQLEREPVGRRCGVWHSAKPVGLKHHPGTWLQPCAELPAGSQLPLTQGRWQRQSGWRGQEKRYLVALGLNAVNVALSTWLSTATESFFPHCQWVPFWLGQDSQLLPQPGRVLAMGTQFGSLCFHLCLAQGAAQLASARRGAEGWHSRGTHTAPKERRGPFLIFWGVPGCAPTPGSDPPGAGQSIVSSAELQRPSLRLHSQHCPDIK